MCGGRSWPADVARRCALVCALVAIAGCGPEPTGRRPAPAPPRSPFGALADGVTISRIGEGEQIRLGGHRIPYQPGDWLITHAGTIAVVSARHGQVIAFGGEGGDSGMVELEPAVFEAFDALKGEVVEAQPMDDGRVLYLREALAGDVDLHVWLTLTAPVLAIASKMESRGRAHGALTLGEAWAWSNVPTWVESHGFIAEGGSYGGSFIAREGAALAYAACKPGGRLNARFGSVNLPGYHRTARTGETREPLPAGGASAVRIVTAAWSHRSSGDAAARLDCLADLPRARVRRNIRAARWLEVASCETPDAEAARRERTPEGEPEPPDGIGGKPFARYHATIEELVVPADCARARFTAPGHAPGKWFDPLAASAWEDDAIAPRAGTLRWQVRSEDGAVLPCKLVVTGLGDTKPPDWGEGLEGGAARHYIYAERDGARPIPPGRYRVRVDHGFEYSAEERTIEVAAGGEAAIEAALKRVVDTAGWISADLHVHAQPSWDAPTLLDDRVRSLAGAGVEIAVATDHNAVTDYAPSIAALGLSDHLASLIGDEVTSEETLIGHFNVFPLSRETPPLPWRDVTPEALFRRARELSPTGVVQVNHPRMDAIGHFELLHLDRGAVAEWSASAPLADMSFDAIEVFNGDHYAKVSEVRWVLDDWFALLDEGLRYTATGNSDSHKIGYQEAGMPRNWVWLPDDAPARFDPGAFLSSLRAGRVIVSSGPFVELRVGTARIGDTIDPGRVEVSVRADAPPWIDIRHVELIRNRHVIKRWTVEGTASPRLDQSYTTDVASGDWLIAVASSPTSMPGYYREAAKPLAFTNPIWVR